MSTCWETLNDLIISDEEGLSAPIRLNNNEFMIMLHSNEKMIIKKFSSKQHNWTTLYSFQMKGTSLCRRFYDIETKSLYLYNRKDKEIYVINLESKTQLTSEAKFSISHSGRVQLVGQILHIVDRPGHEIYDIKKQKKTTLGKICDIISLSHGELVYLQTKNVLLYFGGFDGVHNTDIDTIHQYCFKKQEWICLEHSLLSPMTSFVCVTSTDDRYILILGGRYYDGERFHDEHKHDILIFDTETKKVRKSKISLPYQTQHYYAVIIRQDDEMLVSGYIRTFDLMIPTDIMQFIGRLVLIEFIYLIEKYATPCNFWKIRIDDILK